MAQRIIVELTSDLSGDTTEVESVEFGIDGTNYTVDLTHAEHEKLAALLEPYVKVARKISGRRTRRTERRATTGRATSTDVDTATVREWAQRNGIEVSSRGRVSSEIIRQYKEATGN